MESNFPMLSIYFASVLLGLSVAAPIGPINVEIIRRGLTKSARSAFALGCGAVTADCVYFALALAGAAMASRLGESDTARMAGLAVGGAMLAWLGVNAIRKAGSVAEAAPATGFGSGAEKRGTTSVSGEGVSMVQTWMLGLALTLANPMTIALWLSIAAGFAAVGEVGHVNRVGVPVIRLAGVATGALGWVVFVTAATSWARGWIDASSMRAINLVSGSVLVGFGLWFLVRIFIAA